MASGEFGQDSREELNRRGGQDEGFAWAAIGLNEDRELMRILDQRCQASDRLRSQSPVSFAGRYRSEAFQLSGHRLSPILL
jgi:hypothetical protein